MVFTSLSKKCYTIKNDIIEEIVFSGLESVEKDWKLWKTAKAVWKGFNRLVFQLNLKNSESNGVLFFQNCALDRKSQIIPVWC